MCGKAVVQVAVCSDVQGRFSHMSAPGCHVDYPAEIPYNSWIFHEHSCSIVATWNRTHDLVVLFGVRRSK